MRSQSLFERSERLARIDVVVTGWMARHGIRLLRISLGLVFLWFGALKFFPGLSPAEGLAVRTMEVLALGLVPSGLALKVLAAWECAIGLGLTFGVALRLTLALLWLQMVGAAAPLLIFPAECFSRFPYAPTLEGQYIIKNLVLISAGIVIGSTVRDRWTVGGRRRVP